MPNGCLLSLGPVAASLAFLYSLLGVARAYWVAAVPGNRPEHVRINPLFWASASIVTLATTVWCGVRLFAADRR